MTNFLFIFLASILSTCTVIYVYCVFTEYNFKLSAQNKIFILIGSTIMAFLKFYDFSLLSSIVYFIFFPLVLYDKKFLEFKKCILFLILVWMYGTLFDLILVLILALLGTMFYIDIYADIFVLIPTLFMTFSLLAISQNKHIKKFSAVFVTCICNLNYINVLLITFVFFIFSLGGAIVLNVGNLNVEILLVIVFVLVFIMFCLIFSNILIRFESHLFIKNIKDNNEFYLEINNRNRIFKHNIISKLMSIKSVCDIKASGLVDDLILNINGDIHYENYFKPVPYGLIGVVYQKLSSCNKDINLVVENNVKEDILEILKPKTYNILVEKLDIMLNNAIEACKICNNKILQIQIYYEFDSIVVKVINSFSSKIDIDKLGSLNYSTKGSKHGIGLFSIFRNNEVNAKIEIVNDLFIGKLKVKCRLNKNNILD